MSKRNLKQSAEHSREGEGEYSKNYQRLQSYSAFCSAVAALAVAYFAFVQNVQLEKRVQVEKLRDWGKLRSTMYDILDLEPAKGEPDFVTYSPEDALDFSRKIRKLLDSEIGNQYLAQNHDCLVNWRSAMSLAKLIYENAEHFESKESFSMVFNFWAKNLINQVYEIWKKIILDSEFSGADPFPNLTTDQKAQLSAELKELMLTGGGKGNPTASLESTIVRNEAYVIAAIKIFASAEDLYQSANSRYTDRLDVLVQGNPTRFSAGRDKDHAGFEGGYTFDLTADDHSYYLRALPTVPGQTGRRYFYCDRSGVIRASLDGNAGPLSPPIE